MLYSQTYQSGTGINLFRINSNYVSAEVEYNSGEIKKGLISGFIENENIEILNLSQFSNFESQLNIDDDKFKFKKDENSKPEKLNKNELSRITLIKGTSNKNFYLKEVYTLDIKTKKLKSLDRKVWLPKLRSNQKIDVFGFNLFLNNRYTYTYYYLTLENDKVIRFFDDKMRLCGYECGKEYYSNFLNEVFVRSCEEMKVPVQEYMDSMTKENIKKTFKEKDNKIKEIKKDKNLKSEERAKLILETEENFVLQPIQDLISIHEDKCK
ncbi:hypothetical protein M9Q43_01495 [Flavobacterium sp. HXWNR29]|uniref:hypothetical protein n=1 Tax=Flavobacterium odoriferum TaxID=2946604 RepID=UPI0021CB7D6A|nr:hypothetical protein [Flavobacterium sp. HXWNR29]MCU4187833.1 hypothetical protein [Flavobacterium sp. HXWNR29]